MIARSPSWLDLPYELRQQILAYALEQQGTIELQTPVWASKTVFTQPLFEVSGEMRNEALQAFYENNHFLWIIDLSIDRSDPARYASMAGGEDEVDHREQGSGRQKPLTPGLPWEYPHLKKHLRCLHVNIYLPSNLIGDTSAAQSWLTGMPERLPSLVNALDRGRRLWDLTVLITANTKRFNTRISLEGEQLKALEVLAGMEVKGNVKVRTRYDFKSVKASIDGLQLERRMRA
ncbi:hypothetical protein B0A50_05225 [Salinomyces thailandicus]|uniref:2EXR domain-containing protein n=1 Tax=Salinomyces thailandicus TaxID=706561 RepID=A0A4U0TXG5_9PEZI|nr:hypothetical protein B0A50_05225 [Salinomyces thailandica]